MKPTRSRTHCARRADRADGRSAAAHGTSNHTSCGSGRGLGLVRTRLNGQACCGGRAHLRLGRVRIEDVVDRAHAARRDTKKFLCAGAGRRPRCQWVGAGERALARLREKLTRTEQRIPHRVTPDVQRQPSSPPCCDEVTAAPSSSVIPQVKVAQSIFGTSRLRRTHCVALKSHSRTGCGGACGPR